MKKGREGGVPVFGAGLLLTAFAVVCLTVLTLLSLATAQAERRLAEAAHEKAAAYYAADLAAEELFARLRAGETPAQVEIQGTSYRYRCHVSDHQYLAVELERRDEGWLVRRWQTVAEETPVEDHLQVWSGHQEELP